ncbi:MAG: 30S ribosomal protein S7 [Dehalococcoidales bacterium]|nr:30S ribosomal protein S7 [Dehalococcoidales bacterium]
MPRRARVIKRRLLPDAKYNSLVVSQLINRLMLKGKKSTAERFIYDAFRLIEQRESREPVAVLEEALKRATPLLEVKPRRVGGATYQVPIEVQPERGLSLALRWLAKAARARTGRSMAERLAAELSDAAKGQGVAVKRRDDTHKMAEANRAFAHYRW